MGKKNQKSHLLFLSPPIIIPRDLAKFIGFREAAFLQQLQYRLGHSKNLRDGRMWVYKTVDGKAEHSKDQSWLSELRPVINSEPTMKRTIKRMVDAGIVLSDSFNEAKYDRTRWYTIDYDRLNYLWESWDRYSELNAWAKIILTLSLGQGDLSHKITEIAPESDQGDPTIPETDDIPEDAPRLSPIEEATPDPLVKLYEQIMGLPITLSMFDRLKEWQDMYGVEEIKAALIIAHENKISKHSYILGVLKGRAVDKAKKPGGNGSTIIFKEMKSLPEESSDLTFDEIMKEINNGQ